MLMRNNKAFSIIELLVVIGIFAVLAVFGYPKVDQWLTEREVKKEVNRLVQYIEDRKDEVNSGKYPIIVIGFYTNMELWHMTQEEYATQMKVPAPGWTRRNDGNTGGKSYLNHYKMGPCCLETIDYSNWVKENSGQFQWSGDTWHWMNSRMFLSKNAIIDPGTNHFTIMDNNGNNQDAFIMICSRSNTSNHYGGSGSGPKCNNSSTADNRYVLQMDRSLNVNLFKYNSSTSRWIKTR